MQTTEKKPHLDAAIRWMPKVLVSGFDWEATRSIEELHSYVRTSIDIAEEGEDSDIRTPRQMIACKEYLDYLHAHLVTEQGVERALGRPTTDHSHDVIVAALTGLLAKLDYQKKVSVFRKDTLTAIGAAQTALNTLAMAQVRP